MTKQKYITIQQYNKTINQYNQLRKMGLKPIIKRNWVKLGLGVVCLAIAIFPNGLGVICYPLGFMLLGISFKHIIELKRKLKNKIRGLKG